MSAAGRQNVCLFCRISNLRRSRRPNSKLVGNLQKPFTTSAIHRHEQTAQELARVQAAEEIEHKRNQLALYNTSDIFRSTFLIKRHRQLRAASARSRGMRRENTVDETQRIVDLEEIESKGDIENTSRTALDGIMKAQLAGCKDTRDITRVISTAFQTPTGVWWMSQLSMQRIILERVLELQDEARQKLKSLITLNHLASHLRSLERPIDVTVSHAALEMAASTRSLNAFQDHMSDLWRSLHAHPTARARDDVLPRSVLLRLLFAFAKGPETTHMPGMPGSHAMGDLLYGSHASIDKEDSTLRSWLGFMDTETIDAWIGVLIRFKMTEKLLQEWHTWNSGYSGDIADRNHLFQIGTQLRAFLKAFFEVGQSEQAWTIVQDFDKTKQLPLHGILLARKDDFGALLLENIEAIPRSLSPDTMELITENCALVLQKRAIEIEKFLGLRWIAPKGDANPGYHILVDINKLTASNRAEEDSLNQDVG